MLRIYDRLNQKTAIQFAGYLLDKLPFRVEAIQTDNGSEFQSAFHWHLMDRGIRHIYIKPATPRLNGKVERSHRIDGEEFYRQLKGVLIDDAQVFNDKLAEWQDFCNYHRPHGSLGGAREWEMTRYRAYQAQLAGQPIGETFRRATAFLRRAADGSSLSHT